MPHHHFGLCGDSREERQGTLMQTLLVRLYDGQLATASFADPLVCDLHLHPADTCSDAYRFVDLQEVAWLHLGEARLRKDGQYALNDVANHVQMRSATLNTLSFAASYRKLS